MRLLKYKDGKILSSFIEYKVVNSLNNQAFFKIQEIAVKQLYWKVLMDIPLKVILKERICEIITVG